MRQDLSQGDENDYKRVRVARTPDALQVSFVGTGIHSEAEIQEIGRELLSVVELAARLALPMVISFDGVRTISSAIIGKLIVVRKKAKGSKVAFQLAEMSPPVADVFRRIWPGDGLAGAPTAS
jgi:hypothetical protein